MTSRERVIAALNHSQPDKVPLSIGSTSNDCFTKVALRRFSEYTGLGDYEEIVTCKPTQAVKTPPQIQKMYEADFKVVTLKSPDLVSELYVEYSDGLYKDEFGVLMKPSEYYFDPVDRPLGGLITIDDVNYKEFAFKHNPGLEIEVDGSISLETAKWCMELV